MAEYLGRWTMLDARGYILSHGVEVRRYQSEGDLVEIFAIGNDQFARDDLEVSADRIEHKSAGWYLTPAAN